jgi:hypothetical protein
MSLSLNTPIHALKKTYTYVQWAVNKVNAAHSWSIQKMGGIVAVTGAILAAVKAFTYATIGKAMDWLEQKIATAVPIVIGFLASQIGPTEKGVLRKVLENLT